MTAIEELAVAAQVRLIKVILDAVDEAVMRPNEDGAGLAGLIDKMPRKGRIVPR